MPQLIVLAIAGAGIYAGVKWVARKVGQHVDAATRMEAERQAATGPREMGHLEWDAEAKAYRPARRQ